MIPPTNSMTAEERIVALAQTFHTISDHPHVLNWNPVELDRWAAVASHGEKLAVRFILGVWNQFHEWECGRFDVIEAYTTWDGRHWRAFAAWAQRPFTL